jgi:hypothetical protein
MADTPGPNRKRTSAELVRRQFAFSACESAAIINEPHHGARLMAKTTLQVEETTYRIQSYSQTVIHSINETIHDLAKTYGQGMDRI